MRYFLSIAKFFDTIPITLEIVPGLIRIQTINDVVSPFIIYYLLKEYHRFRKYNYIYISIFLLSLLFAYSRALWILTLFILMIYAFTSIGQRVKYKAINYIFSFILIMPILAYTGSDLLSSRFSNQISASSDTTRVTQSTELYNKFSESVVFGHGLGAYVANIIRDEKEPFSYETQWLALLMQIGVLGVSLIVTAVFFGFFYLYKNEPTSGWPFIYLLWIILPLTNPYLLSSVSAVVFALCLLIPTVNRKQYEDYNNVSDI